MSDQEALAKIAELADFDEETANWYEIANVLREIRKVAEAVAERTKEPT